MAPPKSATKGGDSKGQSQSKKLTSNKKKKNHFFAKACADGTLPKCLNADSTKPSKHSAARLPSSVNEASSNWKALCSSIKPIPSKKRDAYLARLNEKKQSSDGANLKEKTSTETVSRTSEPEIWFDDVDPILLDLPENDETDETQTIPGTTDKLTKIVALDCEMVGLGADGSESALARVSIVNQHGACVYDKYVAPGDEVTDYRTPFSGIRPHNLKNATELGVVCHEVSAILRGRILVGHGLRNDLEVLMIKHPKSNIRDTSRYKFFRSVVNGATPSLKRLAQQFLGISIQSGEHSSVQDAQAAMRLYAMFRQQWESDLSARRSERQTRIKSGKISKTVVKKTATL